MRDNTEQALERLLLRAGALALAWALTAALAAVWTRLSVDPSKPVPRSATVAPRASSSVVDDIDNMNLPVDLHRFALNALLAPLIDDAVPARWTDVALDFMCDDATRVLVDGRPMVVGTPIPAGPFSVRWDMNHCEPFGPLMPLSGGVDLFVSHDALGMTAVVAPDRLRIHGGKGLVQVAHAFTARLSLASSLPEPSVPSPSRSSRTDR